MLRVLYQVYTFQQNSILLSPELFRSYATASRAIRKQEKLEADGFHTCTAIYTYRVTRNGKQDEDLLFTDLKAEAA